MKGLLTNSGGGQRPMTEADIFGAILSGGGGAGSSPAAQTPRPAAAPPLPTQPMNYALTPPVAYQPPMQGAPMAGSMKGSGKSGRQPMPGADPRGNG